MEFIIIAIIIFFVVRHFRKKKKAAAQQAAAPAEPAPVQQQPTVQKAEPVMTREAAAPAEAPAQPKPAPQKTTLDKPQEAPRKTTLDRPQSAPVNPQPAPQGSYPPAPASAIEGLDYMNVRQYTDDSKRIPLMMAFAEAGDELAQYEVGQMYVMGLFGMERNYEKGKALLYKAGHGGATNAIALLAQVSIKQAMNSVTESETLGLTKEEAGARFNAYYDEGAEALAWGISTGNEMAMDTLTGKLALGWNQGQLAETLVMATTQALAPRLEELKAKDDGRSNYVLGMIALRGVCMPQDLALAKSYFQRGAELGDFNAREELKNPLFLLDDEDDDE